MKLKRITMDNKKLKSQVQDLKSENKKLKKTLERERARRIRAEADLHIQR